MTFGEKLKIARTNAGLKQAELAKQLNTTGNTISNWENNVSKPDLDMLSYICGVLNVKASFFLDAKIPDDHFSLTELNMIKKYRALDAHGKEMVDFTLSKEYERTIAMIEQKQEREFVLMAAHNDNAEDPEEQKKMRADLANLKNMKRP